MEFKERIRNKKIEEERVAGELGFHELAEETKPPVVAVIHILKCKIFI